jgi:DNA-binding LytR/AlgR family response regulator
MRLTCLAVDDEPLALDVIETYVGDIGWLEFAGRCGTSVEAIEKLRENDIELLFLDIQLPDLDGFELLRTLRRPPLVIFTTAYEQYAVESYTVDAVDYLVKPFSFERFLRAAQKAADTVVHHDNGASTPFFIRTDEGDVRIDVHDILHVKGMNEYAVLTTAAKQFVVRESLRDIEHRIARYGFLRVHKSWIVSIPRITVIDRNILRVADAVVPIGKTYRDSVRRVVESRRLG